MAADFSATGHLSRNAHHPILPMTESMANRRDIKICSNLSFFSVDPRMTHILTTPTQHVPFAQSLLPMADGVLFHGPTLKMRDAFPKVKPPGVDYVFANLEPTTYRNVQSLLRNTQVLRSPNAWLRLLLLLLFSCAVRHFFVLVVAAAVAVVMGGWWSVFAVAFSGRLFALLL